MIQSKKQRKKVNHSLEELEDGLVLTLQDQPLLSNNKLNEDIDTFENYEKRKDNESQYNRQMKQKIKTLSNAATSHLEGKNDGMGGMLPHYDDYSYKGNEIQIEDGKVVRYKRERGPDKTNTDFQTNKTNINRQYSFNKRGVKKKQSGEDLIRFLNETGEEKEVTIDNRQADKIVEQSLEKVRKRRKTEKESKQQVQSIMNEEEEEMLWKAKEKFRQKTKQSKLLDIIKEQNQNQQPQHYTQLELQPLAFKGQTSQMRQNRKYEVKDAAKGTTSCLFVNLPSEKLHKSAIKQEEEYPDSFQNISPQQLQKMKSQINFLFQQEQAVGLSGTLKYLREHSLIKKQLQYGRANDKQLQVNKGEDRVKLEYRNASGQLMKPKEAFRYLCAIFHGTGPGKNKIEKRKKKEIEEIKMKQSTNEGGKLMKLLEKSQKQTNEAHMVIQLGGKKREQ